MTLINNSAKSRNLLLRRKKGLSHWNKKQSNRLTQLISEGATIAYWCADVNDQPANGGECKDNWFAHEGLLQEIEGPLELCGNRALHATFEPHKWKGSRVWVVALVGEVKKQDDKVGALKREFLGRVLPNEALSDSVACRLGRKDLSGAYLSEADLSGANLIRANLSGADLSGAYLIRADLYGANLSGADLSGADLSEADLSGANLIRANLSEADLSGANLYGAYCPGFDQDGWKADSSGFIKKA